MPDGSSVKDLKIKIKEFLGLNLAEQTLLFENKTLNNDIKKLSDFGLRDGSCIKLIINIIRDVFTFTLSMQTGQTFDIEVRSKDSLSEVRKVIERHSRLHPEEQVLIYLGKIIVGNEPISSYGVQEKSIIQVLPRIISSIQIFGKTMDGKTVAIEVSKTDRIIDIKRKIQEKIGLAPEEQKLVYQGGILEDDKTVDEYQIVEKSVINVLARLRNGMQIFAKTMDGKTIAIEVTKTYRIIDVKRKIQEKIGLAPEEQKLVYQWEILEDDRTFGEYQIAEKSVINIVARLIQGMQIFAKTMDGKTIAVEVTKTDRIIDVKKKIQEKIGPALDVQKLVYQGGILEDDKTVDEYQIAEKSVINIVARLINGMQIFGKTMDGKTIAFEVSKTDRIIDIKKKIQDKIRLAPEKQKLVYQGGLLEDDKTVDEYQIAEKSVINVVDLLRQGMQIFAKTMDGKTVAFEVSKTYRIIDVKKKIQEKIGLAPDEQKLVCLGVLLEDDKTVDEYQVVEKSVINVVARLRNGMQIFARTMEGKNITFEVSKTDRIIDVKKKIQEKIGPALDVHKLVYQGGILEDDKTVDEHQIVEKSVIHIVPRLRGGMQIFAKTMNGKTIAFEVTKTDRIIDIKRKIQEKIGLAPEKHKLVYQGGILEDNKTVDEYQIAEKSVILIVAR